MIFVFESSAHVLFLYTFSYVRSLSTLPKDSDSSCWEEQAACSSIDEFLLIDLKIKVWDGKCCMRVS